VWWGRGDQTLTKTRPEQAPYEERDNALHKLQLISIAIIDGKRCFLIIILILIDVICVPYPPYFIAAQSASRYTLNDTQETQFFKRNDASAIE